MKQMGLLIKSTDYLDNSNNLSAISAKPKEPL
jgi:hypothetical protein